MRVFTLPRWALAIVFFAVLLSLSFLAFGRSIWHDFAPIDDSFLIYNNLALRGITWAHIRTIFTTYDPELYIPLTFFSFQMNYAMGALNPFGYHLANVLLHGINASLVFLVLRNLTNHRLASMIGAGIFAVHPLHTEAVVWIAGRKDLLFTAFFLLSFLLFQVSSAHKRWAYALSLLAFLLALFSKATAMTLPVVLLFSELIVRRTPLSRRLLLILAPYAVLSMIFAAIALGGKERVVSGTGILPPVLLAARSVMFYLQAFIAPVNLSVFYSQHGSISLGSPTLLFSLLGTLVFLGAAVWAWKQGLRLVAFGMLFYVVTLSPSFLNVHKGAVWFFASDRYAYLPSIGLVLLVSAGAEWLLRQHFRFGAWMVGGCGALIVALFTVLAIVQSAVWGGADSMFRHALKIDPASLPARVGLANLERDAGNVEEAFALLKEGLRYGDHFVLRNEAGLTYAAAGKIDEALEQFQIAKSMDATIPEPDFYTAALLEYRGQTGAALPLFQHALSLDPSYVAARVRISMILLKRGDLDEVERQMTEALRWNANDGAANLLTGKLLIARKKPAEALPYLQNAVAIDRGSIEAHIVAMRAYISLKDIQNAKEEAKIILQFDQKNPEAKAFLDSL